MTQAFAAATSQEFAIYHSQDSVGRKNNKTILRGRNVEDAWSTPIKSHAQDLSGRLPLVIGMPIFIVDNMAVELGISNGSGGTLVNLGYEIREGKHYAIWAEVDLPLYTSPDPNTIFPHRVTVGLISKPIKFTKEKGGKTYSAQRHQLPLIPGFSFTAHNSQSRSLNAAIIHLESSASTVASYVMLSRIKCDEFSPQGLAILGEINSKNISTHAPEEVRKEESRLCKLAASTMERAKENLDWYLELAGDSFD
ncbi:hypothetical protein C8R43DRAFT_889418 [Mycena crocata]|nr:hypothetical protein C8R43DRAFT_889418 [Mycena crocata]